VVSNAASARDAYTRDWVGEGVVEYSYKKMREAEQMCHISDQGHLLYHVPSSELSLSRTKALLFIKRVKPLAPQRLVVVISTVHKESAVIFERLTCHSR
jgi:hypothetical protein